MTLPTGPDGSEQARCRIEVHRGAPFDVFRGLLPSKQHAVYVLLNEDDWALYVGQSGHPRTRIRTHWRLKDWFPEVAAIELHLVDDELAARRLECKLTDDLSPIHSEITFGDEARLARLVGDAA